MPDHQTRRDKLVRLVKRTGAQAMLVTDPVNVTYLTGFTGEDSYLLLGPTIQVMLSDFRFVAQLQDECPELETEIRSTAKPVPLAELVARVARSAKISQLAIEAASVTLLLQEQLAERMEKASWLPTTGLVEKLREVKDREEVAAIRRAIAIAERAFLVSRGLMMPDQTEITIANQLDQTIRQCGGTGCSFPPIVAIGPRAALPHAPPTDKPISASPFVLIDWGAVAGGYVSDLTRVLVTAKISPKLERIYRVVLNAKCRAIAAIQPGVAMKVVDSAARSAIADAGYGKYFGHGLGHGIGLQVHESPRIASNSESLLRPGMVVTVEPGIYLPGWGGVRIEDDVLVTRDGHEVLSSVPKEFADCIVG